MKNIVIANKRFASPAGLDLELWIKQMTILTAEREVLSLFQEISFGSDPQLHFTTKKKLLDYLNIFREVRGKTNSVLF